MEPQVRNLAFLESGELALVWYIGNGEFSKFSTKKIKNVRRETMQVDLSSLCQTVREVYPELLEDYIHGQWNPRKNIQLSHMGLLVKGLVIMLRTQLQNCKHEIQVDYTNLRRRDVPDETINLIIGPNQTPKQINLPNNIVENRNDFRGRLDISFQDTLDLDFDLLVTPRQAAGGDFEDDTAELDVEPTGNGSGVRPQERRGKGKCDRKKPQRNQRKISIEDEIFQRLENLPLVDEHQFMDWPYPLQEPWRQADDNNTFNQTELPPVDMIVPDLVVTGPPEEQCHAPDVDISPKRKPAAEAQPTAPRKKRGQAALELGPLDATSSPKTPRSKRRRRQLQFGDGETRISDRDLRNRVRKPPPSDAEIRALLMEKRWVPSLIPLEGLALIEKVGRKLPTSGRLNKMMVEHLSKMKNRVEPNFDFTESQWPESEERRGRSGLSPSLPNVSGGKSMDPTPSHLTPMPQPDSDIPVFVQPPVGSFDQEPFPNIPPDHDQPEEVLPEAASVKTFEEILGPNPTRLEAAKKFATLLRLMSQKKVMLHQEEPYSQITIQKL